MARRIGRTSISQGRARATVRCNDDYGRLPPPAARTDDDAASLLRAARSLGAERLPASRSTSVFCIVVPAKPNTTTVARRRSRVRSLFFIFHLPLFLSSRSPPSHPRPRRESPLFLPAPPSFYYSALTALAPFPRPDTTNALPSGESVIADGPRRGWSTERGHHVLCSLLQEHAGRTKAVTINDRVLWTTPAVDIGRHTAGKVRARLVGSGDCATVVVVANEVAHCGEHTRQTSGRRAVSRLCHRRRHRRRRLSKYTRAIYTHACTHLHKVRAYTR